MFARAVGERMMWDRLAAREAASTSFASFLGDVLLEADLFFSSHTATTTTVTRTTQTTSPSRLPSRLPVTPTGIVASQPRRGPAPSRAE